MPYRARHRITPTRRTRATVGEAALALTNLFVLACSAGTLLLWSPA